MVVTTKNTTFWGMNLLLACVLGSLLNPEDYSYGIQIRKRWEEDICSLHVVCDKNVDIFWENFKWKDHLVDENNIKIDFRQIVNVWTALNLFRIR
jgi:hypothetical protein